MRYRKLSPTGDFVFGHGQADYYINSPQAVTQAIETALRLVQGEWFLDTTVGVPYFTQVLGYGTRGLYDAAMQEAILGVTGVQEITSYSSFLNTRTRLLTVTVTVVTIFSVSVTVSTNVPQTQGGYGVLPYGTAGYGI